MQSPMPYPQQPQQPSSSGSNILVIVVVALVGIVVLVGILAVLAISGVRKYVQNAKTAEALNSVGAIGRSAATSYESESPQKLCARASKPVPELVSMVSGKKYQSSTVDWSRDATSNAGFACLRFEMSSPQYYQYDYQVTGSASRQAAGDAIQAIAHGDLDGNGVASTFSLTGRIGKSGTLDLDTTVAQTNPTE
jgi:type IV pilus assembly protein PilA